MARQKKHPKDHAAPSAMYNCTAMNLRMATRAVTQFYDGFLAETGVSGPQFSLLAILSVVGPIGMSRLAERMVMDRTTLTRNLKPLERDGLVEIRPGEDRRARLVAMTDAGRAAFERARPRWAAAQSAIRKRLGDDDWQSLIARLQSTVAAIR